MAAETAKSGSSGLLAIISGKSGGSKMGADLSEDPKSEGPAVPYGEPYGGGMESDYSSHSFSALAKAFGIPAEKQGGAQAALKQYIKACIAETRSEPDEDD